MSYSFIQTPATASLAQSPMIFSVSSSQYVTQPNFQYVGRLNIWQGADSSSAESWILTKYPSTEGFTGIFDVGRIINSTQTTLVQANSSSITNYSFDSFY